MSVTLIVTETGSAYRESDGGRDMEVCPLLADGTVSGDWVAIDWRGLDDELDELCATVAYALRLVAAAARTREQS